MKLFAFIAVAASLVLAQPDLTAPGRGRMYIRGGQGILGDSAILPGVALDIHSSTLSANSLLGLYLENFFGGAASGSDGIRIHQRIHGFTPYYSGLLIYPPILDSSGNVNFITSLDIMDCVGADSACHSIQTRKGKAIIGDTLTAARLFQQGGGEQLHGSLLGRSRQISADTDHVMILYPDSGHTMHDTLPLLSQCLGCDYWFVQYQLPIDSPAVIIARAGDKIEGFDSVSMRSNLGISSLHLYGQGNKWRVLYHYEKGAWLAYLNTISDTAQDTAWYTINNLTDVHIWMKQLKGTSNSTNKAFGILGANTNFTDATLDTSYSSVAAMDGRDSGFAVPLHCVMFWSGVGIRCVKTDTTAFKGHGQKGTGYMMDFWRNLPRIPVHR